MEEELPLDDVEEPPLGEEESALEEDDPEDVMISLSEEEWELSELDIVSLEGIEELPTTMSAMEREHPLIDKANKGIRNKKDLFSFFIKGIMASPTTIFHHENEKIPQAGNREFPKRVFQLSKTHYRHFCHCIYYYSLIRLILNIRTLAFIECLVDDTTA